MSREEVHAWKEIHNLKDNPAFLSRDLTGWREVFSHVHMAGVLWGRRGGSHTVGDKVHLTQDWGNDRISVSGII